MITERKTTARAVINLFDTSAKQDSYYMSNSLFSYCDLDNLDNDEYSPKKIATCEKNVFLLDGSFNLIDENTDDKDFSYWSEDLSDENGEFSENPAIERSFMDRHTSNGLTLIFDRHYDLPVSVEVTLGNSTRTFDIDSYVFFCDMPTENYQYMKVEFTEINPYAYARLQNIEYGQSLYYSADSERNLAEASVLEEVDPISSELPIGTSSVKVIDEDGLFSITNPKGLYKYLQQRQIIDIYEEITKITYDGDGLTINEESEEQQIARHYVKEWKTENDVVSTFDCQNIIGLMDSGQFDGNLYENEPVENIINEIMTAFGFTNYSIDPDIADIELSGVIEPCSFREALQQVLFACGGTCDTSRSRGLYFFRVKEETYSMVFKEREFMSPEYSITQNDMVTGVSIVAHGYQEEPGESQAFKGDLSAGNYRVSFKDPYRNISGTNCLITDSGYYYADITVVADGEVSIAGIKYVDYSKTHLYEIEDLPANTMANIKKIENATLISEDNVKKIAEHIFDYYHLRLEHSVKIILDKERAGHFSTFQPINSLASVLIKSMRIDLTGGFLATIEGIGFSLEAPLSTYAQEISNGEYELYANDNEVM